jgi:hypothetical protein
LDHLQGKCLTQFEFFAVAVSIILALGISRLLDGVLPSLNASRRYWVHLLWILQKLFNHIFWWWGTWSLNSFESWNIAWFVWTVTGPIILYLQATALVTTSPQDVESWEEHFYEIRPWFFSGNIVICGTLLFGRMMSPDILLPSVTLGLIALAALATIGIATNNRRVHGVLAVMALSIQILGFGTAMFNAGAY